MRRNLWVVMLVSITTNIGMWFERFVRSPRSAVTSALELGLLLPDVGRRGRSWAASACSSRCSSSSCASCPPSRCRGQVDHAAGPRGRATPSTATDHDHGRRRRLPPPALLSPPQPTSPWLTPKKLHGDRRLLHRRRRGLMAARRKSGTPATSGTPTRRSRSTASTKRWASSRRSSPWIVLHGPDRPGRRILLQWYTNAFDYVFPISGKPDWSSRRTSRSRSRWSSPSARSRPSSGCWRSTSSRISRTPCTSSPASGASRTTASRSSSRPRTRASTPAASARCSRRAPSVSRIARRTSRAALPLWFHGLAASRPA